MAIVHCALVMLYHREILHMLMALVAEIVRVIS